VGRVEISVISIKDQHSLTRVAQRGEETFHAIIVALYKAGFTPPAISPIVSRPRQTVSTIINRYHTTGTSSSTRPGRCRVLDERSIRQLIDGVRRNNFACTPQHHTTLGSTESLKSIPPKRFGEDKQIELHGFSPTQDAAEC
jgi:hypothetical protein